MLHRHKAMMYPIQSHGLHRMTLRVHCRSLERLQQAKSNLHSNVEESLFNRLKLIKAHTLLLVSYSRLSVHCRATSVVPILVLTWGVSQLQANVQPGKTPGDGKKSCLDMIILSMMFGPGR